MKFVYFFAATLASNLFTFHSKGEVIAVRTEVTQEVLVEKIQNPERTLLLVNVKNLKDSESSYYVDLSMNLTLSELCRLDTDASGRKRERAHYQIAQELNRVPMTVVYKRNSTDKEGFLRAHFSGKSLIWITYKPNSDGDYLTEPEDVQKSFSKRVPGFKGETQTCFNGAIVDLKRISKITTSFYGFLEPSIQSDSSDQVLLKKIASANEFRFMTTCSAVGDSSSCIAYGPNESLPIGFFNWGEKINSLPLKSNGRISSTYRLVTFRAYIQVESI
jgi:hypothetical protein